MNRKYLVFFCNLNLKQKYNDESLSKGQHTVKDSIPFKISKKAVFNCRTPSPAMLSDVSSMKTEQIPVPC